MAEAARVKARSEDMLVEEFVKATGRDEAFFREKIPLAKFRADVAGDIRDKIADGRIPVTSRLARADWPRFDFEAFQRAGDNGGTDEQIAQIPEPFRLHARITASIRFELNAAPARQNVHA